MGRVGGGFPGGFWGTGLSQKSWGGFHSHSAPVVGLYYVGVFLFSVPFMYVNKGE